ncbi:hypothetical protein L7F22_020338 [Adiantum nelumboides]|nr:hypothetical protein [Adiantum nelumboides]
MEGILLQPHCIRFFCCCGHSNSQGQCRSPFAIKTCLSSRIAQSSQFTFSHCSLKHEVARSGHLKPLLLWAAFKEHSEKNDVVSTEKDDENVEVEGGKQTKDLPITWNGAKPLPLALSLGIGLSVYTLLPRPETLSLQAWQLLAIFVTTIMGLVSGPLPVGAWAFFALTLSVATGTLPFSAAFSAFTNEVIWLIVISFFFARGFVKTGLGDRIATLFVKMMGGSTLGLSYGLTISEALIAPAMPSTTARAGGVFLPIIQSLSLSAGSKPNAVSSKNLGSFLVQCQFQVLLNNVPSWFLKCFRLVI